MAQRISLPGGAFPPGGLFCAAVYKLIRLADEMEVVPDKELKYIR